MTRKISISIPDELHAQVEAMATATGGTVSGFFQDLAQEKLEADQYARERLAALTARDRAVVVNYDERVAALRERMHAAQHAAAAKKKAASA